MCAGPVDPRTSIPWIYEWIGTAMPFQKTKGFLAILQAEPVSEHLEEAREWYWKIKEDGLQTAWTHLALLTQLIIADPRNGLLNEAREVLEQSKGKTRPSITKLANCVARAHRF